MIRYDAGKPSSLPVPSTPSTVVVPWSTPSTSTTYVAAPAWSPMIPSTVVHAATSRPDRTEPVPDRIPPVTIHWSSYPSPANVMSSVPEYSTPAASTPLMSHRPVNWSPSAVGS